MQVALFRHGIAEDREAFARTGAPDGERPLTSKGIRRTRQAAGGLLVLLPAIDVIATSPYTRARQTAEILAGACSQSGHDAELTTVEAMQPDGDYQQVCRFLSGRPGAATVVLVGHEPDLSLLMAWLTTGAGGHLARFKKAGACLIDFDGPPAPGGGELQWLAQPAMLRTLAG